MTVYDRGQRGLDLALDQVYLQLPLPPVLLSCLLLLLQQLMLCVQRGKTFDLSVTCLLQSAHTV
jgi:hypothetical protein